MQTVYYYLVIGADPLSIRLSDMGFYTESAIGFFRKYLVLVVLLIEGSLL